MDHIASVRAALKASAPVVAIPVEGRAPVCIKARLLKGALKGVTIHSVKVLENGWLKVTGRALTQAFRKALTAHKGTIESLPENAFAESGTNVNTVIVTMEN